ncbi:MAG: hypothetical protein WAX66_00505, partial [Patescibacteria group bacterium]
MNIPTKCGICGYKGQEKDIERCKRSGIPAQKYNLYDKFHLNYTHSIIWTIIDTKIRRAASHNGDPKHIRFYKVMSEDLADPKWVAENTLI